VFSVRRQSRSRVALLALPLLIAASPVATACTSLLVSRDATVDGSTFVTYSCDGGVFAAVRVVEGASHGPAETTTIFADPEPYAPSALPSVELGMIPQVPETYRYLDAIAGPTYVHIGGMNEHGVSVAETTLAAARPELKNPRGLLAPFSSCPERSLMTLALQRARTAREAVLLIGALAQEHGYSSPFPIDGEQLAIADGEEVWSMEIFGPGTSWRPGSGKPGAVWCARRIPDGHVGISANRSRIGEIDLADPDNFLASANVASFAQERGWWDPDRDGEFNWSRAYAPEAPVGSLLREWRAFDLVAPSLELAADGPIPFSVEPDRTLTTEDVMAIQRDLLEGTPFDITDAPVFFDGDELSPLACPMCSRTFYELLGLDPERAISNRRSSFTALYQTRVGVPAEVRGCAWYGFGPAATTCYLPIYTGVTELPSSWGSTELAGGDLSLPFWTMILPGFLATAQWQDAFRDLEILRTPAESRFLAEQRLLTDRVETWHSQGEDVAKRLNGYTADRLAAVVEAYRSLADHMLVEYVVGLGQAVDGPRPFIQLPLIP
jgi:dipeptidase